MIGDNNVEVGGYLVHVKHGDRRKIVAIDGAGYVTTESHQRRGIMHISFYLNTRYWKYEGEQYDQTVNPK